MNTETTCGVTIYDRHRGVVRTCGARATHVLIIHGDQLFSLCPRHNERIDRAFPALVDRTKAA